MVAYRRYGGSTEMRWLTEMWWLIEDFGNSYEMW